VGVTTRVRADADEDRSERELRNKSGAKVAWLPRQYQLSGAANDDCCGEPVIWSREHADAGGWAVCTSRWRLC
jgi:hypothetical protein